MPIEATLFAFAHQDDEFGVFQRIADCRRRGQRVICAYLTDGAAGTATSAQRNAESLAVLRQLGVAESDVFFAGETLGIPDTRLAQHLPRAQAWLREWLGTFDRIESLHVIAWEGGHPDHDALHALIVHAAQERGLLDRTYQFSLYNAAGCPPPFFKVLSPLAENGPVIRGAFPWSMRWRSLRFCLSYPSQRGTWIGLFPFVVLHHLFNGSQALQLVRPERVGQRPHSGPLYYETRKFFTWAEMAEAIGYLAKS